MNRRNAAALLLALLLALTLSVPALALEADSLVPMGAAVGIRLETDGVMVAGLAEVETAEGAVRPAEAAGLQVGDVVKTLDGRKTDSAAAFLSAAAAMTGAPSRSPRGSKSRASRWSLRACVKPPARLWTPPSSMRWTRWA